MPTGFVLAYSGGAAADSHRFPYFPALPFAYERSRFEGNLAQALVGVSRRLDELFRAGGVSYATSVTRQS